MEPLKGAKLLLAKAKDDEILLEEIITNERIREEIVGFHAQYTAGGASPGTSVKISYQMIRLDPATLMVEISDQTFHAAISNWISCRYSVCAEF
jgi:hypothetical protein